jgi:hypothetical protein
MAIELDRKARTPAIAASEDEFGHWRKPQPQRR